MKKYTSILVIILAITAIFTSSVLAAPAASTATLISVSYNDGGVVLIFETSGLTKSDLKGATIYADSNWHNMYCTFVDHTTTVRCTAAKNLAGQGEFYAVLAGVGFWGSLPQPHAACSDGQIPWYSYNEYHNGVFVKSAKVPVWIWDEAEASGFFKIQAKAGYTFQITGSFCAPEVTII